MTRSCFELAVTLACYVAFLPFISAKAPAGPWDAFNFSPSSRTVRPTAIHSTHGTIQNVHNLVTENGVATFPANRDTWITLDFGKEVGGWISLTVHLPPNHITSSHESSTTLPLALSFTESPLFISPSTSDDSPTPAFNQSYDGVEYVTVPSRELEPGASIRWTQPIPRLRGGFRYLTIISNSSSSPFVLSSSPSSSDTSNRESTTIGVSNVTCQISFMPHIPEEDLRSYAGYFYASDPVFHDKDFLTKIWYAGAYTVQTNIADGDQVREVPVVPSPGWDNAGTIGISGPVILDGAKRDREVWPGDMGISLATSFLTLIPTTSSSDADSSNNLTLPYTSSSPIRNSLIAIFARQNPETGELPWSAQPVSPTGSDTYHMWTIIGVHDYFLWSGDAEFVEQIWGNYTKAMQYVQNKITPSGLMNVTGVRDWGRLVQGGTNSEANAILYRALTTASQLSSLLHLSAFPSQSTIYASLASTLKSSFQSTFWDPTKGLFRDNNTTTDTIHPQDANSLAVLFGLTESAEQARRVSEGLKENWGILGAVAPELTGTIIPFIGGFELQAHFIAGNDDLAMDLLRLQWGFMLYTNISVQSTLLEGYNFDGTLSYRATSGNLNDSSFTSHAHGWSTGPTPALTFYVLGLTLQLPTDQAPAIPYQPGQFWSLSPHLAGLESAEGGFETSLGWFGVKWSLSEVNGGTAFTLSFEVPLGTSGTITLPKLPSSSSSVGSDVQGGTVRMDGVVMNTTQNDSGNLVLKVGGGNHTIIFS